MMKESQIMTQNTTSREERFDEQFYKGIDFADFELSDKEKRIMELRHGLIDGKTHTLEEVGKEFGVTRERIRQIEAKIDEKKRQKERVKTFFLKEMNPLLDELLSEVTAKKGWISTIGGEKYLKLEDVTAIINHKKLK